MAIMIPTEIPSRGPGARAERAVFSALHDQLSDDYFVYSRLQYVDDERHTQGEADFLVLHRRYGMLFIECKGEGVERTAEGRWRRLDHGHWKPMKEGPLEQAERTRYEMVDKLKPRIFHEFQEVRGFPFVHGHAVAFPFATIAGMHLPLDAPRILILDSDDLDRLRDRIPEILQLWASKINRPPVSLEDWQFKVFRRRILHPQLHVVDSLAGLIKDEERALVRLTRQQVQTVEGLLGNRRLLVKGGAGTGKTVLALEAAKRLRQKGLDVQFLCFNKALRDHLKALLARDEAQYGDGALEVTSFSALNAVAFYRLGHSRIPVPGQDGEKTAFWNEDAPSALSEAIEKNLMPRFDVIVVDEAQDFAADWWQILEGMLKDDNGRIIAFCDPAQEIFGRGDALPAWPTFELTFNFRNTVEIARVLNRLGHTQMVTYDSSPQGEPPVVFRQEETGKTLQDLAELVKRLVRDEKVQPDQIAILTPHRREHSILASVSDIAGISISPEPSDRQGRLLHATIGGFKGLESDVLILLDIDPQDPRCSRNARYVAASRARHRLFVFAKGDWLA